MLTPPSVPPSSAQTQPDIRKFRLSFGSSSFISTMAGTFESSSQLTFCQPYPFRYDNQSSILSIQIYRQHKFAHNDDYKYQLNAEIDLNDITLLKGDYVESVLTDIYGSSLGRILLLFDVFRKGGRYGEKVPVRVLFERVHEGVERERERRGRQGITQGAKVSQANRNIRNLIVNNQLSNILMIIQSMHVIPEVEDQ